MIRPGLIVGLFVARLLLEGISLLGQTAVSLPLILLVSGGLAAIGFMLDRRFPGKLPVWPTAVLSIYLFWPYPHWALAIGLLLLWATVAIWSSGGQALSKRISPAMMIGGLSILFLILYWQTLAPGLLPADSGEFQWVAAELGVAHPPGFPLYTLLTHLMTRLPIGETAAFRVNLFSAIVSATTLFCTGWAAWALTRDRFATAVALLTLGTATTFWAQATTANIRSLTGLFAALAFYLLIRLRHQRGESFNRTLITAVFFTSIGINHHPSLIFMSGLFVLYVLSLNWRLFQQPALVGKLIIALLPGLLPLLYLPLRAGADAPGATDSLATWNGFWNHVLARGFQGDFFFFTDPPLLLERLRVMGNVMQFQFSGWLLLGMLLGAFWLLRQEWRLALLLVGSFLIHLLITATYRAPQTVEYMLPAYVPAVLLLATAVHQLKRPATWMWVSHRPLVRAPTPDHSWQRATEQLGKTTAVFLLLVALGQGYSRWPSFAALAQSQDTHTYATTLLSSAPANSQILSDWHWYAPLRYLQAVKGMRPDVQINFVAPGAGTYGETWARRIETALEENGRSVIATHFDTLAYASLPPPQPLGEAFLFAIDPLTSLPPQATPLDLTLNGMVQLLGYHLEAPTVRLDEPAVLTLYWQPTTDAPAGLPSLYVHLVGFDGALYGQDDQSIRAAETGLTATQFRLFLRPGSQPGDFSLLAGVAADRQPLTTLSAIPARWAPLSQNGRFLPAIGTQQQLIGYDWDHTLPGRTRLYLHWRTSDGYLTQVVDDQAISQLSLPDLGGAWGQRLTQWQPPAPRQPRHYVPFAQGIVWLGGDLISPERPLSPGEAVVVRPRLGSQQPLLRDTAVSVRLIGYQPDGQQWAWWDLDDSIPAMGGIPTLKWIQEIVVVAPHFVQVAPNAGEGQSLAITLRLYDAFTERPLAILDDRITAQFPWVPAAQSLVVSSP